MSPKLQVIIRLKLFSLFHKSFTWIIFIIHEKIQSLITLIAAFKIQYETKFDF